MRSSAFFFLPILIILLLSQNEKLIAQGTDIRISVSSDNQYSCEIPSEKLLILPSDLRQFGGPAFWRGFFVFGDGNYYYYTGHMSRDEMPPVTYKITNSYLDTTDIGYDDSYLLVDHKTDNPPPSIIVNDLPPTILEPIPQSLSPVDLINVNDFSSNKSSALLSINTPSIDCKRVKLEHSHNFLEAEDYSVFILAYHLEKVDVKLFPDLKVKLLFFLEEPFDMDSILIHQPNYYLNKTPLPLQPIAKTNIITLSPASPFKYVLVYDVPIDDFEIDDPSDGEEEQRIMYYIKAASINSGFKDGEDYKFMVALATDYPIEDSVANNNHRSRCAGKNYNNEDDRFIMDYININGPSNYYNFNFSPLYKFHYLDADSIIVRSGKPKDPNGVEIKDICQCANGNFKVTFDLKFCNISHFPTSASGLFIEEVESPKVFTCFEPVQNTFGPDGFVLNPESCTGLGCQNCTSNITNCASYNFCDGCNAQYCVGYSPISTAGNMNDCHTFTYVAQTNRSGINKLIQGQGALKASVNFQETDCEILSTFSEQINPDSFPISNCLPAQSCSSCPVIRTPVPNWVPFAVAAVIILILIWIIVRFFN